jgi:hypothetical protein
LQIGFADLGTRQQHRPQFRGCPKTAQQRSYVPSRRWYGFLGVKVRGLAHGVAQNATFLAQRKLEKSTTSK